MQQHFAGEKGSSQKFSKLLQAILRGFSGVVTISRLAYLGSASMVRAYPQHTISQPSSKKFALVL